LPVEATTELLCFCGFVGENLAWGVVVKRFQITQIITSINFQVTSRPSEGETSEYDLTDGESQTGRQTDKDTVLD